MKVFFTLLTFFSMLPALALPPSNNCTEATRGTDSFPAHSFASVLCTQGGNSTATGGTFINQGMSICQATDNEKTGPYLLCGDSIGGDSATSSFIAKGAWVATRDLLETSSRLPGIYQNKMGEAWHKDLNQVASRAEKNVSGLKDTLSHLQSDATLFQKMVVSKSISDATQPLLALQEATRLWSPTLTAVPAFPKSLASNEIDSVMEQAQKQIKNAAENPRVSSLLQGLDHAEKIGTPAEIWKNIEVIGDAAKAPTHSFFKPAAQDHLNQTYQEWIATDGLLSNNKLNTEGKSLRAGIAPHLKTLVNSESGQAVRREINRGLLGISHPESVDAYHQSTLLGGIALALGADEAFQTGSPIQGAQLLHSAMKTIDFALGLIPVVSSVNDVAQIVFGMVTGYDYTGSRMTSADFALRGFTAILGLVPLPTPAVKLGVQVISESFIDGAKLIRSTGLGLRIGKALAPISETIGPIAESFGALLGKEEASLATLDLEKATEELEALVKNSDSKAIAYFAQVLSDAKIKVNDRLDIIRSFIPETIEFEILAEDLICNRWHDESMLAKKFSHYVSEDLILDRTIAREALAIPPSNHMLYLDQFRLPKGTLIFKGKVAPNFGHSGGATQTFIIGDVQDTLQFLERLVQP